MSIIKGLTVIVTTVIAAWSVYTNFCISRARRERHKQTLKAIEIWVSLERESIRHYSLWAQAVLDKRRAEALWHHRIWERLQPQIQKAHEEMKRRRAS